MKGFRVRKLLAAAAGAALLGTALIPAVSALSLQRSQVYSASGAPLHTIVVGSKANISDAVWAGNIAAALAQKATRTENVTISGTATGATPNVTDLVAKLVVGGTVTLGAGSKQYKINLNSASGAREVDANLLTDAQLSHLYNKSTT